jgi:transcriptional regulator with XRE-family HTH domain
LGDHIRKRRLELRLHQKDVAVIVNATTSTVTSWEKGRTHPRLYLLPKIFDFLKYNPLEVSATSLGKRIKNYRVRNGLSLRKLAKKLGVDPGTLTRWERKQISPSALMKKRLHNFLDILL